MTYNCILTTGRISITVARQWSVLQSDKLLRRAACAGVSGGGMCMLVK